MEKPAQKPPGQNILETAVSLAKLPTREAFLIAKKTFNGSTIDLKVKVETNLENCQQLWQRFSSQKSLFDTWNFRWAFWLGYRHQPYFLTITFKKKPIALLPLWYEKDKNEFRWFGGWWQEDNVFFSTHKSLIPVMLKICPKPILLSAISCSPQTANKFKLALDDPKYLLHLQGLNSAEAFLDRFRKKRRYNLKRDRKKILAQNPKTIFNRFGDLQHLIKISMNRFHKRGQKTDWDESGGIKTFEAIIESAREYQPHMITTEIKGKIAGVDLVALYKKTYFSLVCAYDIENFPGIGNYTNLLQINDALSLGMEKMDFLETDYGWKAKLLEATPLYQCRLT